MNLLEHFEWVGGSVVFNAGLAGVGAPKRPRRLAPDEHRDVELFGQPDDVPADPLPLVGGDVQERGAGAGEVHEVVVGGHERPNV